ncbi:MAG: hypothetical protein ABIM46_05020 [candidate division WOR-3 bacterium]
MEVLGHSRRYAMVRDAVSGVIQCGKLSVMALASFPLGGARGASTRF